MKRNINIIKRRKHIYIEVTRDRCGQDRQCGQLIAECYILDKFQRRVTWNGEDKTMLVQLDGQSRDEALKTLDTRRYEFKEWW